MLQCKNIVIVLTVIVCLQVDCFAQGIHCGMSAKGAAVLTMK